MIISYIKIMTIIIFSIYASINDVKTMKVTDKLNKTFAVFGILFILIQNNLDYVIVAILTFYASFLFLTFLGGGDLKFLTALSLYIGPLVIQVLAIYCSINMIRRFLLKTKGSFPAMPDITVSIITTILLVGGHI